MPRVPRNRREAQGRGVTRTAFAKRRCHRRLVRDAIELRHAHDLVSSIPDCLENGCEGCRAEAAMALDVIEHLLRRHSRPWRRAVLPHQYPADLAPEADHA